MTIEVSERLTNSIVEIDASGLSSRELNTRIRAAINGTVPRIVLRNVHGQRYIGTDLDRPVEIEIFGTPGNDLGAFMNGPHIIVRGNAQDGCGNTMNEGEIVIHGHAGDITGLSARGGKIFVRDSVGYRAGIHMKEYGEKKTQIVIGGMAQDFFGEYMAGGIVVLLGLNLREGEFHQPKYVGTGMHGGAIYLRGAIKAHQLGKEVGAAKLDEKDYDVLGKAVREFAAHFGYNAVEILKGKFIKLYPKFLRPYGRLYTY
ncbi:MAG: hypothetical protein HY670_08770 [Chloroflexi bacterium]|nr:hypothetical protein [Chloroflexota bacterium]